MHRAIPRLALSGVFAAVLVAALARFHQVNDTAAALLIVLCVLATSIKCGWAEALTVAILGGISFDYYFLGRPGFSIEAPEYGVALAAFAITAIATGQLAALSNRRRKQALERQQEAEKLSRLSHAILTCAPEFSFTGLADQLVEIFEADGVALYDQQTGRIVRSGPRCQAISDQALFQAATVSPAREDSTFVVTPIRCGLEQVGSMAISGERISEEILVAVAERVELALARQEAVAKATEAEVNRRSQELKSAALDSMAHEIRNALNSAKVATSTLLSGHEGPELNRLEMLTIVDEELDRMDRFIDEAVRVARLEAKDLSPKRAPQIAGLMIAEAIAEMSVLTGKRLIRSSVPDSLPRVKCDRDMIVRVLKQLLSNALKYSNESAPIVVSAAFRDTAIVIDVVDCGPGIGAGERDRIFEKYYRGAAASGTQGTGLGLASARSIVWAQGGEIWVTSPPAGGAAFHVSLPVVAGAAPETVVGKTVEAI